MLFYRNRYRVFPCGWSRGYAYAGWTDTTAEPDTRSKSFQESRHFGHGGGSFGARRPLRHLSYRLDLDESQQRVAARVLDQLKMEMEQARLDEKKTVSEVATLVSAEQVDASALEQALAPRVTSAQKLQAAVAAAVNELAGVLDRDQREELAHLLRSGVFRI